MGRRTSLAALAGAKVEEVPGASAASAAPAPVTVESATAAGLTVVQRIPLSAIVPTPLNSRRDFGSQDALREFGESLLRNQLQAVVIVPRDDYLKLWPEHVDATAAGEFILAAGERRWRGLQAVDAAAIDAVVRPGIAESKLIFLDAVFTENFARKNLDAIEEANAIEELVKVLGTARAVAEYYGKTEGWASQRRKLLQLALPMQHLVSRGEMPIATAREICKLPLEEQEHAWLEIKNAPAAPRKPRATPAAEAGTAGPENFTAVKFGEPKKHTEPSQPEPAARTENFTAVKPDSAPGAADRTTGVPAQASSADTTENFTAVKPDEAVPTQDTADSTPEDLEPAVIVLSIDRRDLSTAAKAIREAMSARESYELVSAVIDSLRDDPEFAAAD